MWGLATATTSRSTFKPVEDTARSLTVLSSGSPFHQEVLQVGGVGLHWIVRVFLIHLLLRLLLDQWQYSGKGGKSLSSYWVWTSLPHLPEHPVRQWGWGSVQDELEGHLQVLVSGAVPTAFANPPSINMDVVADRPFSTTTTLAVLKQKWHRTRNEIARLERAI